MIHHLQHIVDLVEICRIKGIEQIVISPGSRNAPLTRQFTSVSAFTCHSIVDERSAAFFALGIALATKKPTAMVCTSGTAVLNYAPAIAEAYYQHIPLIAITADRPPHLVDQQDNQTIHQEDVYRNYIKRSINLKWPVSSSAELKKIHNKIAGIIDFAIAGIKGPVQINIPIEEPLYRTMPDVTSPLPLSSNEKSPLSEIDPSFISIWQNSKRRIILCGQNQPSEELNEVIHSISSNNQAIILSENIANISNEKAISALERVMCIIEQNAPENLLPDLLISFGGPVVSKRIKQWLQKQPGLRHWRIAEEEDKIDTYQNRKSLIKGNPVEILTILAETGESSEPGFIESWHEAHRASFKSDALFFKKAIFSDATVFHFIMNNLPEGITLHLGNSAPVRYAQMYASKKCRAVYANRGVSGIDGCLSTASGIASASGGLHMVLMGDLSFIYDSNALWNRNLSKNLHIVVINNSGGGIFRLLQGPAEQTCFEPFMEAHHPVDLEKLTTSFGVKFQSATNQTELENIFQTFLTDEGPSLLEIKTNNTENPKVYSAHIESIKGNLLAHHTSNE